jgi:hypothetical protein
MPSDDGVGPRPFSSQNPKTYEKRKFATSILVCCIIISSSLFVLSIHPAKATSTLTIDGSNSAGCGHSTNSCATTLSTSTSNDIVIVYAFEGLDLQTSCTFSVQDTSGLTWSSRGGVSGRNDGSTNGYRDQIGEFWARSLGVLSSDVITESISGCASTQTGGEYNGLQVFGIAGANYNAPFDPNTSLPGTANAYSNTPSVTISTTNANDMVISAAQQTSYGVLSPGSGFTGITPNTEYELAGSPVTNLSVTWGDSATWYWEQIVDAVSAQSGTLTLDGSAQVGCGHSTNSCSTTFSTSHGNDVVIVYTLEGLDLQTSCTFSVSDTAGLSWSLRASAAGRNDGTTNGYRDQIGEFWAKSSGALSSDTITESISGCASPQYGGEYNGFQAFGVSGANLNAPFDPATIPGTANGYSNTPSVAISTSNSNDMIISAAQQSSYGTLTPGSGFAGITANTEFKTVGSPVTNFSVTWGDSATWYWEMIADAITGQASPPDFSMQSTPQLNFSPAVSSGTAYLTLYSSGGFSGTVNISFDTSFTPNCYQGSCSVTPTSASVNVPASGSAQLQFTVSVNAAQGSGFYYYFLRFIGTSGSLKHVVNTYIELCIPLQALQSTNWAGYVMSTTCMAPGGPGNPIYQASASWYVPDASEPGYLACFNRDCVIAPWVGLMHDSKGATGIVQVATVTTVHCFFGCSTSYKAVWELYPANQFQDCGITVNAGDWMFASITDNALNGGPSTQYTLEIDDKTMNYNCKVVHSFADFKQSNGQPYPDMGTPYYAAFVAETNTGYLPRFSSFPIREIFIRDFNNNVIGGLTVGNNGWWQEIQMYSSAGLNVDVSAITASGNLPNGYFMVIYKNSNGKGT